MNKMVVWFANLYGDENDPPIQWVIFIIVVAMLAVWLTVGWPSPAKSEPARGDFLAMRSTPDLSIASNATGEVLFFGPPASYIHIRNDCANAIYFDLRSSRDGNNNLYPLRLNGRHVTSTSTLEAATFTFEGRVHSLGVSHGGIATSAASCTYTLILAR